MNQSDSSPHPIHQSIAQTIKDHAVVLFMKGTPAAPLCGFSAQVVKILKKYPTVSFHSVNILKDQTLRAELKVFSQWPTFPQLYVDGEFVGGCDIVMEMQRKDTLKNILQKSSSC